MAKKMIRVLAGMMILVSCMASSQLSIWQFDSLHSEAGYIVSYARKTIFIKCSEEISFTDLESIESYIKESNEPAIEASTFEEGVGEQRYYCMDTVYLPKIPDTFSQEYHYILVNRVVVSTEILRTEIPELVKNEKAITQMSFLGSDTIVSIEYYGVMHTFNSIICQE